LLSKQEFYNLNICLKQLVRLSRNCVRHFKTGADEGPDLVQLFEGRGKIGKLWISSSENDQFHQLHHF
jgi:hypothetical protein